MDPDTTHIFTSVEDFVRNLVVPYELDPRRDDYGAPTDELVEELQGSAGGGCADTPMLPDRTHPTQRETATILKASGLSPLGPVTINTASRDEANMYMLGQVGSELIKQRFLARPLRTRTAVAMTSG